MLTQLNAVVIVPRGPPRPTCYCVCVPFRYWRCARTLTASAVLYRGGLGRLLSHWAGLHEKRPTRTSIICLCSCSKCKCCPGFRSSLLCGMCVDSALSTCVTSSVRSPPQPRSAVFARNLLLPPVHCHHSHARSASFHCRLSWGQAWGCSATGTVVRNC